MAPRISIEVVSDTVCPWCYIGKRRMERALQQFKGRAEFSVHWLPFFLNPNAPEQGVNKVQMYNDKFGPARVAQMVPAMTATFAAEGLNYSMGGLTGSTRNSHRLLTWAAAQHGLEAQNKLAEELFKGYFTQEKYINDPEFLLSAAAAAGCPGGEGVLDGKDAATEQLLQQELGKYAGISGVPHFVINGSHGLLAGVSPVHEPAEVRKLLQRSFRTLLLPENTFRNYFGEEVGYYIAFLNALWLWLLPPAAVSAWLWRHVRPGTETPTAPAPPPTLHSSWVPLLALLLVVWGAVGLKLWRRRSIRLAWRWDVAVAAVRQEPWEGFKGHPCRSPITGETMLVYPATWRAARVVVTTGVALVTLVLAGGLLLLVLNLQGYVPLDHTQLYVPWLARLTLTGAVFDAATPLGQVPTAVRVLAAQAITAACSPLFKALTAFENHATVNAYTASLQAKRFALEALLAFGPVAYVALAGAGAAAAAADIATYYSLECARRLLMDVALPLLMLQWTARHQQQQLQGSKSLTGEKPAPELLEVDAWKTPFDTFDDYLSIVKDAGYILLFAAVYPYTPLIALAYTWVKMKADALRLARLCQRPRPRRVASIAPWGAALGVLVYASVITNIYFCGISTQQLCALLPLSWTPYLPCAAPPDPVLFVIPTSSSANQLHLQKPPLHPVLSSGPSWTPSTTAGQLLALVCLEHLLYLLLLVIHVAIPDEPGAVRVVHQKADYVLRQLQGVEHRRSITQELFLGRSYSTAAEVPAEAPITATSPGPASTIPSGSAAAAGSSWAAATGLPAGVTAAPAGPMTPPPAVMADLGANSW